MVEIAQNNSAWTSNYKKKKKKQQPPCMKMTASWFDVIWNSLLQGIIHSTGFLMLILGFYFLS